MAPRIRVALETTPKKTFATAIDWPGWSRSGKTAELALEALAGSAERYRPVATLGGEALPASLDLDVVETADGGAGTEFGVPSRITEADRRKVSAADADRLARLVAAAWQTLDAVAKRSPESLRKGPRGGGRDRTKLLGHCLEADNAYAREMGLKLPLPDVGDRAAIEAHRAAMLEVLRAPAAASPLADRRWTVRYAAHRVAWHSLDHAWEMEDRREP
jgi:hypothetical protein